jgi:serine/threonine protein kinase
MALSTAHHGRSSACRRGPVGLPAPKPHPVSSRSIWNLAPPHVPRAKRKPVYVPRQIGPVELIRPIGRGGMGVVWLGRHQLLRTNVAVKFILPQHDRTEIDERDRQQFLDGARAAACIRHPGLTRILHADIVNNIPYLVMEFINGLTIEQARSRQGRFDLAAALSILDTCCGIVAHLHERYVVHGDIKSSNVLLDKTGRLYVTDFGLARRISDATVDHPSERRRFIAGTPEYMAPEMFEGQLSLRTDVYALGILAYELVCGRLPFIGQNERLWMKHKAGELPPEPLLKCGVPDPVISVIERATNLRPIYRLKCAGQLREVMRNELGGFYDCRANRQTLFGVCSRAHDARSGRSSSDSGGPIAGADAGDSALSRIASEKRHARERSPRARPRAQGVASSSAAETAGIACVGRAWCSRCRCVMPMTNRQQCTRCGTRLSMAGPNTRPAPRSETKVTPTGLQRLFDLLCTPLW